MAERINLGWLKDYNSNKFAPKTIASQILNNDGTSYAEGVQAEIDDLWEAVKYQPIAFKSCTTTNSNVTGCNSGLNSEDGATIGTITFNWSTNKTPAKVEILKDSAVIATPAATTTSHVITANLKTNAAYVVRVTEQSNPAVDTQATAVKSFAYSFRDTCYYGALASGTTPTSANITALSKKYFLSASSSTSFTVNPGTGNHIVFATPSSFGTPVFKVGGFAGGFYKHSTISLTNGSGKTQNYDVYFSDQTGFSSTTVDVSL